MFWRKEREIVNLKSDLKNEKSKVFYRNKFIEKQQEELEKTKEELEKAKTKYRNLYLFELSIESLVNGKREPEEIIDRIKKELSSL